MRHYFSINPQDGRRQILLGELDCKGFCPIHHAARKGFIRVIDALLAGGDDLYRMTADGTMDVADVAEKFGHADCLRFILNARKAMAGTGDGARKVSVGRGGEERVFTVNPGSSVVSIFSGGGRMRLKMTC